MKYSPKVARPRVERWIPAAIRALGHLSGAAVLSTALLWVLAPRGLWAESVHMWSAGVLRAETLEALGLHFLLGACLWGLLQAIFICARRLVRSDAKPRMIRKAGTVVTETLVVLPVLLMLIFGLAQLTLNNIAGVVLNVAAFQGARSAWLWTGESCGGPECDRQERARVQTATTLTPVVPDSNVEADALPDIFRRIRGGLVGLQLDESLPGIGERGTIIADSMSMENTTAPSLSKIMGTDSFARRTIRKMTSAYACTRVEVAEMPDNELKITVRYFHKNVLPMVGPIFGVETPDSSLSPGYYAEMVREFNMTKIPPPNRRLPPQVDHGWNY